MSGTEAQDRALVAVVGAGTMGAGIAQVALEAGWKVALFDSAPGATDRAIERIRAGLVRRAQKAAAAKPAGAADPAGADDRARAGEAARVADPARAAEQALLRLAVVPSIERAAGSAQLVIEAAIEDLSIKRDIFAKLGEASDPGAILATNTSALLVSEIASAADRPERVVGLHFFNPAPVLPLVEVVRGRATADWAVETAAGIVEGWGKTAIRVSDSPGFIVNRVNRPFTLEPLRLLRAGVASIEALDQALVAAGFPMGPFALMDLIGIDVNLAAARGLFEASGRPPRFRPSPIQEELVSANRLGRKSGEGFYRYAEGHAPVPARRFASFRAAPGVIPLDGPAIAERVILAIVNEAYRALGDRIATADDIDRAMRLGANHPFGPFEWAARTGLHEVAVMLDALSDEDADTFRPALSLLRQARSGV